MDQQFRRANREERAFNREDEEDEAGVAVERDASMDLGEDHGVCLDGARAAAEVAEEETGGARCSGDGDVGSLGSEEEKAIARGPGGVVLAVMLRGGVRARCWSTMAAEGRTGG
ncbi:hypothetical protein PR202_gb24242 [Eleusine coracana subsp. coracana]|uniref:Uncharacterized protein n=1 Tax=Eleusine coracana subsp. coracana TaxID=191504 RepID=A0AAV5FKK5_ELECO|nr:hypothetical protein PR202_gb24242 [Eleusine coracana subsp. coracana]